MSNIRFADLVKIYRAAQFGQGEIATVKIEDQQTLDALRLALQEENLDDSGISVHHGDPDDLGIGKTLQLHISSPRIGLGRLARNLSDLLTTGVLLAEPRRYYLIDERFANGDENVPESVERYRKLLKFVDLLKECADYVDAASSELIFIKDGKFSIPVVISANQIAQADLTKIEKILNHFTDDTHKAQKLAILTNAVLSITQITAIKKRFGTLILEVAELAAKFNDGYKIFIADFSYDKIKDKFEEAKIENSGKLHKIFSDIQNQLLTLPVATVIVATQMKGTGDKTAVMVNAALLIGVWIFAALFSMLWFNQLRTLLTLELEIKRQEKILKEDYESVGTIFNDVFAPLYKRIRNQKILLGLVCFLVIAGLVASHYFYFEISAIPPANQLESKPVHSKAG
jgi:hypothetical protein